MIAVWTGEAERCVRVVLLRDGAEVWSARRWLPHRHHGRPAVQCPAVRRAVADLEAELRAWMAADDARITARAAKACENICALADQLPD